jgi:integrase
VKVDIHNFKYRLECYIKKLKERDDENSKLTLEFLNYLKAQGIKEGRLFKYAYALLNLSKLLGKNFKRVGKQDVVKVISKIESNENYSEWTKREYKIIIRKFYKWLKGSKNYPKEVEWIKIKSIKINEKLFGRILTKKEIEEMASKCDNPRDKALILILFESGCRIGELLPLRMGDIQFDTYGIKFAVRGKTGTRWVRIIEYQNEFRKWLEIHPFKSNHNASVWIGFGNRKRFKMLGYGAVRKLLKNVARKAGINKPVNPHAFRHASATYFCRKLPEALLRMKFGWSLDSKMPAIYLHLNGKDLDEALLRTYGIKEIETREIMEVKVKRCSACGSENPILASFCEKCGIPLSMDKVLFLDSLRRRFDEFMVEFLKLLVAKNPGIRQDFRRLVKKLGMEDIFEIKKY